MRKQSLLVSLILTFALVITACGQKNPFPGTWRGTYDLTDFITASVSGGDEDIEKYLEFENLSFEYVYEFTEGELQTTVDEASFESFSKNFKNSFLEGVKAKIIADLEQQGLSYEEYVDDSGLTEEELIASKLEDVDLDAWIASIRDVAEVLAFDGSYMYTDDTITILFDNGTYTEMKYAMDGKTMTITISDGEMEIPISCEKQ